MNHCRSLPERFTLMNPAAETKRKKKDCSVAASTRLLKTKPSSSGTPQLTNTGRADLQLVDWEESPKTDRPTAVLARWGRTPQACHPFLIWNEISLAKNDRSISPPFMCAPMIPPMSPERQKRF